MMEPVAVDERRVRNVQWVEGFAKYGDKGDPSILAELERQLVKARETAMRHQVKASAAKQRRVATTVRLRRSSAARVAT